VKTILFDLDGTLLPVDTDRFIEKYLKAVARHVAHLVAPDRFVTHLMDATMQMIRSTDLSKTNAEVFAAHFYPAVGMAEADLLPLFDQFYSEEFPKLQAHLSGLPGIAREVVQTAVDQGYEIVVATNPLFPMPAIRERLRWIEVHDFDWKLITAYEEMHAAKPNPAYYAEILERIGRRPEECLMVGNDLDEDGAAAKVGIPTFFITDRLINRAGRPLPEGRYGTLAEFKERLLAGTL
jgi:HAD superfamily hydrolase (TIGR01549 family)